MMVPSSCSSETWPITASWTFGSNSWPSEATGRRPSSPSTSASWSLVACTPSRMSPPASSARSRLSRTGRSSCTSLSEAIDSTRTRSRSWRLREFSNSAFRRCRASRYWSRSRRVASSSTESTVASSHSRSSSLSGSTSGPSGAPGLSPFSREAGLTGEPSASSTAPSSCRALSPSSGSRLFSSLLKAPWSSCGCHAGSRGESLHPTRSCPGLSLLALLAVLILVDDLGVLHQVIIIRGSGGAGFLLLCSLTVENFGEFVGGGHQILLLALDLLDVVASKRLLGLLYGLLYLQLGVRVHLAIHVLQRTLDGVHQVVSVVADVSLLAALPVLFGVRFRILHHLLDLRVREAAGSRDRDPLLLAGP